MATGRLTEIIKARRESGSGVASSLAGGVKERLKEKLDPRRIFNQTGLLTALFPKLRAYKANVPEQQSTGEILNQSSSVDNLATTKPLFESINVNTKIIANNTMALPLIQKDTNLMRQTLRKIIKVIQARKRPVRTSKPSLVTAKGASSSVTAEELETEKEEPAKEKSPIEKLLGLIMAAFSDIGKLLTKTLTELPGKIVSGIVSGIKGLFTATKIASSVLLSILRPLLGLIFSPAGFALLLAAGVFYSLYKLSNLLTKKVAEEVPNMNVLSPSEAAALMKNASKRDLIAQASAAAGRKTPFTYEEAVEYLKDQILNGQKIAEEGLKLVAEEKRLTDILNSGDESKIQAEGGEETLKKKISELKIRIANLGGEKKFKQIISESANGIPVAVPPVSEMVSSSEFDKSDQNVNKTAQGVRRENQITRRDNRDIFENIEREDRDTGKTIRLNEANRQREKMDEEGYGARSPTSPLREPPKIGVGLTNLSIATQDGPGTSAPTSVPTPPKATVPSFNRNELELSGQLNQMNEGLATQGQPYEDIDSKAFATYSSTLRIVSPLNDAHPDIVKALKIKMHEINSMMAF